MSLDWDWIFWQGFIPLAAPLIIWLAACAAKSTLTGTPALRAYLKTFKDAIEEYGWLTYAVFISLQSSAVINAAATRPTWLYGLNLFVLVGSVAILAIAFVSRFDENAGVVTMKPLGDVPIQRSSAGLVALAAAVVGYFAMSTGKIL